MEINEALSVAKQLKNHFRAFEKLDEFLKEIAAGQVLMKELQHRKAILENGIVGLQKQRAETEAETDRYLAERRKDAEATIEGLKKKIPILRASMEKLENDAKAREQGLMETLAKAEVEHRARMVVLTEAEKKAQEKLASTKAELEALRAKLA